MRNMARCCGLGVLAMMCSAGTAWAVVIQVPADAPTISAALAIAQNGDEIVVAPGTYAENNLATAGRNIVLRSSAGPTATIIDGGNAGRIFVIESGETSATVIDGFTFTRGQAAGGGAGFIGNASPVFRNCVFIQNVSSLSGGALIISNANFDGSVVSQSTPRFENCRFEANTATSTAANRRGGAVSTAGSTPTFVDCAFVANVAGRAGGGVGIVGNTLLQGIGPVVFERCLFDANVCDNNTNGGAGVHNVDRDLVFIDCTFQNHTTTATSAGATGIVMSFTAFNPTPLLTLTRTTFTGHTGARPIVLLASGGGLVMNGGGLVNNTGGFNTGILASPPSGSRCEVTITGAAFTGNISTRGTTNTPLVASTGNGFGDVSLTDVVATDNVVSAVLVANGATSVSITGGTIARNTGGAGMIVANPVGAMDINGTAFSQSAGLIFASGPGTFVLRDATFTSNTGVAANLNGFDSVEVRDTTFTQCAAGSTIVLNGSGGGETALFEGVAFVQCSPTGSTGSLISLNDVGDATFRGIDAAGCTSSGVGASILQTNDSPAIIEDSTFTGNSLTGPGATLVSINGPGSVELRRSVFEGNATQSVTVSDADAIIESCRIIAGGPGAIEIFGDVSASVTNCLLVGGTSDGVLLYMDGTMDATVVNCTIVGGAGGTTGVLVSGDVTLRLANSIVRGNLLGEIDVSGATILPVVTHCNIQGGYPGTAVIDADPTFADAAANDFRLLPGSPSIDAGDNSEVPPGLEFDASGLVARFIDDPCTPDTGAGTSPIVDHGAFESEACVDGCDPDFNADGNVDQDDIACLAQLVAGDPSCSSNDPDFNRDGNVDQDDIDALAQVVAGAECP